MKQPFRIGTRGSKLALWQADHVSQLITAENHGLNIEIRIIKTTGDAVLDSPLSEIGGKGVFVKEIEEALLSEEIDIAVHSMKDVPTVLPNGLFIGAVAKRHDPRDALISKSGLPLAQLPEGSRVGTGSLRRSTQLLKYNSNLEIVSIRGNVDTRIRKLKDGKDYDAIVLAVAGLERMGLGGEITEIISPDIMLPAPGQGMIAIECRQNDRNTIDILNAVNHSETEYQARAERAFLLRLGGDCNVPAGCHAEIQDHKVILTGIVSSPDGKTTVRKDVRGSLAEAQNLGVKLADAILESGGNEILKQLGQT